MKTISTNLNELAQEHYKRMLQQGFGADIREKPAEVMDVVCELGEAVEALRICKYADLYSFKSLDEDCDDSVRKVWFDTYIKDTFEDELADALLRILYIVGRYDIDIDTHIREKMWYNSTRDNKHGKLF